VTELDRLRQVAADQALAEYDFGESLLEGMDGWEPISGDQWSRTLVFAPFTDDGASTRGHFEVQFAPGQDAVLSASANIDGLQIGCPAAPEEAPDPTP
jgi:hypothetical protein